MARTIAQLDTEREKTEKARPGGVPDTRQAKYASGATLKEYVRHADEIERLALRLSSHQRDAVLSALARRAR